MKKFYLFLLLVFGAAGFAHAQTSVTITYANDSAGGYCPAPVLAEFNVGGSATGYNTVSDSATVVICYGDGTSDTTLSGLWQGNPAYWGAFFQHTYALPGNYNVKYVVIMPDGETDTVIVPNEIIVSSNCGNITGTAYIDNNSDCINNAGDTPLAYQSVFAYLSGTSNLQGSAATDASGFYSMSLPTGVAYDIVSSPSLGLTITCPSGGSHTSTAPASGLDFGSECQAGFDLLVSGWGNGFVPGSSQSRVYINGTNNNCAPKSGQLKLVASNPLITFLSGPSDTPDAINGDTMVWNFTGLDINGFINKEIWFSTDTLANIGDTICFEALICPSAGDQDPSNNSFTFCRPVAASYDPNNKLVTPIGNGSNGAIQPNQLMTYTINFQNTGTAPAMNVSIRDTINTQVLDFSTFHLIGSSHPLSEVHMIQNNTLKFDFNGINLPDSTNNEPQSHGWVQYSIMQQPDLAPGTVIDNRAAIYFDWNAPVITEYAHNTIAEPTSTNELRPVEAELASIYPNPTHNQITVALNGSELVQYQLLDLTGKVIAQGQLAQSQSILALQQYPEGIYLLKLSNSDRSQLEKIVLLR